MTETHAPERNWAGTYTYRAEKLHRPTTMEQVQQIVANAASVHVLGSRHSFNDIADSRSCSRSRTCLLTWSSTMQPTRSPSVEV